MVGIRIPITGIQRSVALLGLAWLIGSCGDSVTGPPPPPPPTTDSVVMSATSVSLVPAATAQLSATAKDRSGQSLSRSFTWTSSDQGKATVSAAGLVTGVGAGVATITASVDGKSATSTVTVLDGGVVSTSGGTLNLQSDAVQVIVPPDALAAPTNVSVTPSTAFANDPRVVKDTPFDFGPSGATFAKPVTLRIKYAAANLPQGTEESALQLHLSTTSGWQPVDGSTVDVSSKIVSAQVSHFSVYAILLPLPVATVTIRGPPDKPLVDGVSNLVVGDSQQLTATPTDAQGGILSNRIVTWATSDATIASVTAGGLVTAIKPGSAAISASAGGVTSSITVKVAPAPVASLTLALSLQSIHVGETSQASAVTKDVAGNVLADRAITWSSDAPSVATVSQSGLVTAVSVGTAQITGTSEGKSGGAAITVTAVPVASVTVSLNPNSITAVGTAQATATTLDANGATLTGRAVAWSSSDVGIATVDATGLVTAHAVGSATITGASEGKNGSGTLTVTPAPVASVTLSAPTTPVLVGETQVLTATPKDGNGGILAGRTVNWASSNTAVLTVSASSSVSTSSGATVTIATVGPGTATITATSESAPSATTPAITVNQVPVATVTVSPPAASLVLGITPTQLLTAVLKDANGTVLTGRSVGWTSSNHSAATVDANGLVLAVAAGSTTITATSEGESGTSEIAVTVAPVASVTVSLNPNSITAVGTAQATATTLDANGATVTGRAIAWTSLSPAIATVSADGVVTAVAVGTATITATSEGKGGSATITVTPAPVATIKLNPLNITLVQEGTQQLTATLEDDHHSVLTGRTIDWSTDAPAVATVSATGLVTAVASGVATIAAVSESKIATTTVTVTPIPVASVSVSLAAPSVVAGQPTQATATTLDAHGTPLTGRVISWASDNASVASVSSSGLVTSVAAGTANIIATSETITGQATLTVTPVPVATVTVNPANAEVIVGSTQQLTAVTKDGNGAALPGRQVTWTSNNETVATVDANGLVASHAVGSALISAASEGKAGTSSVTVVPVPVASVTVSLAPDSITAVGTAQATAVTRDVNGAVLTGRAVLWNSSNPAVATVSALGVVSAVAEGTTTITAESEGKTGSALLTVTQAPVATVTVDPPSVTLFQGATEQFAVVLKDAHQNVLSGRTVVWSSNSAVATVSTNGLVTAASSSVGTATITATSEGQTGTATITVSEVPVASVSVALSASTINVGQNTQATATLRDAANDVLTGRTITWTSDNPSVAAVSTSGVVTALAEGTAHIFAASGGQNGSATLTVTPIPVASVGVSLAASSIQIGQTTQATATTRDANNNPLTGRAIEWSSDNTDVATVSTTGLVTAVAVGSATISASSEGKSGSSSLTVIPVPVASLTLSAPITPMVLGQSQQLTATPRDAGGAALTGRTVNWVSSNPAILSVSAPSSVSSSSGATIAITAAGVGTAIITANSESAPSTSTPVITVNPIPVATVTVAPASASLVLGITPTQQLTATVKDANDNVLTGRAVAWTSSHPSVATVDADGFVTAVDGGSTTITATSETKTGTASITVTVPVSTVTVTPSSATLTVGLTHLLTATLRDLNNNTLTGRPVAWSSSDPAIATVSTTGLVTAVAAGDAVITAASEGKSGTSSITVTPIPVASVSVSLSASTIHVGQTAQATATTFDGGNNILTGRLVTWSSGNTGVANVSSAGVVTPVAPGTTTIIATSEGKTGSAPLTVTPAPVATVTVSAPTTPMIVGGSQQLTATTKDANDNVLAGRSITWASSNTAVLAVSSSGSPATVTAVGVGAATITATSESVSSSPTPTITVNPIPVASVNVTLAPTSITAVGTSQATATTLDANGNPLAGRAVVWSSENTAVATVSSTTGLVTAVTPGTANIIATSEGQTGSASLTVTPAPVTTVTVSPTSATVVQGDSEQLSVTLRDARGDLLTGRTITWASSNSAIATVAQNGMVTAVSPGSATITATSEGQSGTSAVTVSPVPVASVSVTLASSTITDAQTTQATATARDADGNVLTGRTITWSSDNTAVATVSSTGVVTAVGAGSAHIQAATGGQGGSSTLSVIPAVSTVIVNPPSANVVIGTSLQLAAETRDATNTVLTGRTVTWSSSAPSVASVSTSGLVTAVGFGDATINAASEGKVGTSSITVIPVPVALVTVSLASTTITVGQTTQATATTRDASNNILTGRSVTWSTSNSAVATVSSAGNVTAVGAGSVQVIAMSEGKTGSATLTVNPPPVASLVLSTPSTPMVVGGTQVLTAQPKDGGGNTLSGRTVSWVSSNPAVLTVSAASSVSTPGGATIVVTAVDTGTAAITATSEAAPAATTPVITVDPAPVATVTVALTPASITAVGTSQAAATTLDANGVVLTGRSITWSSGNNSVATVDAQGVVTALSVGTASITAMSEGKSGSATITVTQAPVATVTVSLAASSINAVETTQATATLFDSKGRVLTGRSVAWSSDNTGVATVSSSTGLVTAVSAGSANIVAVSEGTTGSTPLTVTAAPVATVTVTPGTVSLVVGITPTQQLTAETRDANANILTGRTVTWSSSNTAAAAVDGNGLVTAVDAGTTTITATSEGKVGTSSVTVSLAPVASVTISAPTTPMIVGGTQQLTATTRDANGNLLTGRTVTWVSSNDAVLTVSASGSPATVTAVGVGSATVTATSESVTSSPTPTITVNPVPVATVTVSPATATLVLGITPTQQLATVLKDANGTVLTGRSIDWTSSTPGAATVDGNGLVTAVGAGSTTITATSEGKTGTSQITVTLAPVATVTVTPATASLVAGATQQLSAVTKDANSNVLSGRAITWSSSDQAIASVDANGLVTAVVPGSATITATSEGKSGTSTITVTPVPVASVTVSINPNSITAVETAQATATTLDSNGQPLTGREVSWSSSDLAIATVSAQGLVTAEAIGTATITATSEGKSGVATITVTQAPVVTVAVALAASSINAVQATQATATLLDSRGRTLIGRTITWSSDNTAVATVNSSTGLVTAASPGTASIIATSEGKTGSAALTVTPAPVMSVTVTPSTAGLVLGITPTQQLTAVLKDANDSVLTGRSIEWISSNPGVATVDGNGLVTAVGTGSTTVTATSETKTGTSLITVTLAPVTTLLLWTPITPMVAGDTQLIRATPQNENGVTLSGRIVTWTSSNTAVLTVSVASSVSDSIGAAAHVTAVAPGTATITATTESVSTTTGLVTVIPVPVAKVTVSPGSAIIIVGRTQQLSAVTQDYAGNVLTGRTVTWVSANPAVVTVDANGLITADAVGGPVEITATSEGQTATSSFTVIPMPLWRGNEPAGMTFIRERSFTSLNEDPVWGTLGGSGATIVTDPTAPRSPPNVLRIDYPAGFPGGVAPANTETSSNGSRVFYFCYWIKHSANWQGHNTGINKHGYVWMGNNPLFVFEAEGSGSNPLHTLMALEGVITQPNSDGWYPQNLHPEATFTRGEWDYVEILLTGNTSGTADGELDVYLNGVHVSHWTGIQYSSQTTRWDLFRIFPVWGGVGDVVNADQSLEWDHVYMSEREPTVATVTVSTPTTPMMAGQTQELTATLRDAASHVITGRTVTWVSSDPAVLTVNPASGTSATTEITAVGVGTATITATSESVTSAPTPVITVIAPVASVTVSPPSASLMLGITPTQQLTAVLKDANGIVLTGRSIAWTSSNQAAATVDANGLVTAVGAGSTTITATSETTTGTSEITVALAPVTTVTVNPSTASVVSGTTQQLSAETRDANNNLLTGRVITWSSSDETIAKVDVNGLVTGHAVGAATITATSEGKSGTSAITVTPVPVASVTISINPTSITAVETAQATATTLDSNGQTLTGREVTWSSSDLAIATVSAQGLVTAEAVGTATITATSEGKSGSATITVTQAPVATVTVALALTSINGVETTQATATLLDSRGRTLTGRTIEWSSSNMAVATVNSTSGLVAGVSAGTANIIATSEGKTGSATLTVTPAPVATVTVSPPSASIELGLTPTQQLTAVVRDAHGTVLTDRVVTWSSSNPTAATVNGNGLVTAAAEGSTTITATSEGQTGTSAITVLPPPSTVSLLHRSTRNPRYFENVSGQLVLLAGSHTWSNLRDNGTVDPPPVFDYAAYLDFLVAHNHNVFRLYAWEQQKWTAEIASDYWFSPGPYMRTGPDTARDGKPKFDLTQFNQSYFDRMRQRVIEAGTRGVYVSVMLFNGWSVTTKPGFELNNPWKGHPFNIANNINGIDGDTNHDGLGIESQTLDNPGLTAFQDAYVRKVIDAVGDLDNVLYEISNESDATAKDWQYHMIQVIRDHEGTRSKQHPIGITPMWPGGNDADLYASSADWISISGDVNAPITATGAKVSISDTDHLCGKCGDVAWVWKTFLKGHNLLLMDGYDGAAIGLGAAGYNKNDPVWEAIRKNMGYARSYAERLDLANAVPHGDLVDSEPIGYCLAKPGSQYLVFIPGGGSVTLDLSAVTGTLSVEWFNPSTGVATDGGSVSGGEQTLTAPFSGAAVVFIH